MYTEINKTYAKFRRELLALCPYMGEREIYRNWWRYQTHTRPGDDWTLQQTPKRGVDSKYHYLYVTTPDSTGEIYVGIHSTLELDDGYSGSGDEVRKCKDFGVKLDTTVLEFFRTREEALAMERHVVNARFLVESGVLNKTIGGDDSRHVVGGSMLVESSLQKGIPIKRVSVEMPFGESVEVPVLGGSTSTSERSEPTGVEVKIPRKRVKTQNWFPFSRFGIGVGDKLAYLADESVVADVLNDEDRIKVNGESGSLRSVTDKIAGKKVSNCLRFWSWNGKSLFDLKNEILKKGG